MKNEVCVDPPALSPEGGEGRKQPGNDKVKVCPECGLEFVITGRKQIFCCRKCAQASCARKAYLAKKGQTGQRRENVCQYNEGVDCAGGECSKCGWNPAVAKARQGK